MTRRNWFKTGFAALGALLGLSSAKAQPIETTMAHRREGSREEIWIADGREGFIRITLAHGKLVDLRYVDRVPSNALSPRGCFSREYIEQITTQPTPCGIEVVNRHTFHPYRTIERDGVLWHNIFVGGEQSRVHGLATLSEDFVYMVWVPAGDWYEDFPSPEITQHPPPS